MTVRMTPKMRLLEKTVSLLIEDFNLAGRYCRFALLDAVNCGEFEIQ